MNKVENDAAKQANKKIAEDKAKVKIQKAKKNLQKKIKEKEELTKGNKK